MKRLLFFVILFQTSFCGTGFAQRGELNLPNHGDKRYYFGITFAYNRATFNLSNDPRFLQYDSVQVTNPVFSGGFSMGFIGNLRLTPRFEIRYNPQLIFAEKSIDYHLKYPNAGLEEGPITRKKIESIIFSSPFHLKLNSDRIGNFSFYAFTGVKIDYDLASNARKKRAEDLVKLSATDFGVEAGVGFQFYFESFIFTPEIKISNGVNNLHFREEGLKFSNVIDQLRSRMIVFSIHLQG